MKPLDRNKEVRRAGVLLIGAKLWGSAGNGAGSFFFFFFGVGISDKIYDHFVFCKHLANQLF